MVTADRDLLYRSQPCPFTPLYRHGNLLACLAHRLPLQSAASVAHLSIYIERCYGEQLMQLQAGG